MTYFTLAEHSLRALGPTTYKVHARGNLVVEGFYPIHPQRPSDVAAPRDIARRYPGALVLDDFGLAVRVAQWKYVFSRAHQYKMWQRELADGVVTSGTSGGSPLVCVETFVRIRQELTMLDLAVEHAQQSGELPRWITFQSVSQQRFTGLHLELGQRVCVLDRKTSALGWLTVARLRPGQHADEDGEEHFVEYFLIADSDELMERLGGQGELSISSQHWRAAPSGRLLENSGGASVPPRFALYDSELSAWRGRKSVAVG